MLLKSDTNDILNFTYHFQLQWDSCLYENTTELFLKGYLSDWECCFLALSLESLFSMFKAWLQFPTQQA